MWVHEHFGESVQNDNSTAAGFVRIFQAIRESPLQYNGGMWASRPTGIGV